MSDKDQGARWFITISAVACLPFAIFMVMAYAEVLVRSPVDTIGFSVLAVFLCLVIKRFLVDPSFDKIDKPSEYDVQYDALRADIERLQGRLRQIRREQEGDGTLP